jgi:glycosyltransferase involved in cell wall biosynthesis
MISLCVIVKNEAQHLARMLESVRDVVAEIIVVDTGSNDGSAAIAEEYGARIFSYEWSNDFADARNFSLRQATHPWILVLDADEQLAAESRSLINTLIQGPPRGLFLNRKHLCPAPSMLAVTPVQPGELGYDCGAQAFYATHDIRLFPNDPVLRFAGTVHESIEDSLHSHGYTTDRTDVLIYHYGPLASDDRKTEKSKLYLKLAQLKTEQSPARKPFTKALNSAGRSK